MRYVYAVSRTFDPARKPALISDIIEFLLDKPLITLSFRTLALGLGVSTYTLVYHFGSREQLLREIVSAITGSREQIERNVEGNLGDIERHLDGFRAAWQLGLEPRRRQLLRLEFEAAMLETRDADEHTNTRRVMTGWFASMADALVGLGLSTADADIESRGMVDLFYGLQYDLLVTHDDERVAAAFDRAMTNYEGRLRQLVGLELSANDHAGGEGMCGDD